METAGILVVDDSQDLRELYSLWLYQAGYEILQAASGKECLELLNSEFIDLVLLDEMLPDIDGIELCKRIKSQTPSLPVINISGRRTSADYEAEVLEAGADDYLPKPFQRRALLAHINALLRTRHTEEALRQAHDELEKGVEQRTAELVAANSFLRAEIAERKRAEANLADRLRFETVLSELSAAFTGLTSDRVDQTIENWLRRLADFFEIDRASFYGLEENRLHLLSSYTREPFPPLETNGIGEQVPWITAELSRGELFRWSDASSSPLPKCAEKDQQYLETVGIKSNLSIPVIIAGQTRCVLALTSFRVLREWPDEQVARLRLVGEIFANAALRAQSEKALEKSEERLGQVIQGVKDYAIFTLGTDGKIISWNEGARRMKGYEESEIVGKHFSCFYAPEEVISGKAELALSMAAREGRMEEEGWRVRKDGSRFWANVIISAIHNSNGDLQGFLKVTRDITERRLSEEARKRAEEKYRSIVENALDGIFQSTPDGRFISANQSLARMFGYDTPEEFIEQRRNIVRDHYVDPGYREEFKRLIDENGTVKNFQLQAYRKDGTKMWTSENVRTVRDQSGKVMYYEGIVEDITVEKKLEETRQLLSAIVESSSDGIVSFDVAGRVLSWNAAAEKLFGYSAREVQGRDISLFLSSENTGESLPIFQVVETGQAVSFETRRKKKDGTIIDVWITTSPIKNKRSEVIGMSSNIRDITDARRAAEMRTQLLKRLVTAQEDERRRISGELHDQMGQSLAALMLGLKSLEGSAQVESSAAHRLKSLQELTNSLAEEVHTLARHLRPTALDDFGLHTALSNYVEEWSERSEIDADFHSNGLITHRMPADIETAVYRMVQEALTNVLKHAKARNVSVIVEHRAGRVLVIVEDDGCGFDANTPGIISAKYRRLGVLGMEERITLVGGTFNIESTRGVGTTVLANIPVSKQMGGAN